LVTSDKSILDTISKELSFDIHNLQHFSLFIFIIVKCGKGHNKKRSGGPNTDSSVLVMQGKTTFCAELSIGVGNNKRENIDKRKRLQ